jgi:hypothetical protein
MKRATAELVQNHPVAAGFVVLLPGLVAFGIYLAVLAL